MNSAATALSLTIVVSHGWVITVEWKFGRKAHRERSLWKGVESPNGNEVIWRSSASQRGIIIYYYSTNRVCEKTLFRIIVKKLTTWLDYYYYTHLVLVCISYN